MGETHDTPISKSNEESQLLQLWKIIYVKHLIKERKQAKMIIVKDIVSRHSILISCFNNF